MTLDGETRFHEAVGRADALAADRTERGASIADGPISAYENDQFWTDRRIRRAVQLWAEGCSSSEIAREFGSSVSRNAIIGKLHRIANRKEPLVIDGEVMRVEIHPRRPGPGRRRSNAEILASAQARSDRARETLAAREATASKRGRKTFGVKHSALSDRSPGKRPFGQPRWIDMAGGVAANPSGGTRLTAPEDDLAEQSPAIVRLINDPTAWPPREGHAPVSIVDLARTGACRWPVEVDAAGVKLSGAHCCGAPSSGGKSYCDVHARLGQTAIPTATAESRRKSREAERQIARAFG